MKRALWLLAACGAPAPLTTVENTAPKLTGSLELVLVEPAGDACVLRRVDPIGHINHDLARIPGSCLGARISWRRDLARAVVWFDPLTLAETDTMVEVTARAYELDLTTGRVEPLPLPTGDSMLDLGYGGDGAVYAFSTHDLPLARGIVTYLGHPLDFTSVTDGIPAAAIAQRRGPNGWTVADVTPTTTGWDLAPMWHTLPISRSLGPRSVEILDSHHGLDPVALPELERIAPTQADGDGWGVVHTPHGDLYDWHRVGEFGYTTGRVAWRDKTNTIVLVPGTEVFNDDDTVVLVAIRPRDRYVLIASGEAGANGRLYDLVDRTLVYTMTTGRAVTFWPPRSQ
ncbi:MAG: hypothetical protein ABI867_27860 [Kofleriaceae bacterium]